MPRFANEAEEAQWVYDHREDIARYMIVALKNQTLGEGRWNGRRGSGIKPRGTILTASDDEKRVSCDLA